MLAQWLAWWSASSTGSFYKSTHYERNIKLNFFLKKICTFKKCRYLCSPFEKERSLIEIMREKIDRGKK